MQNTLKFAPGISFNLGTHEPPEASGDSKAMGLAQWLLNLRILYNCYSNHRRSESGYFSKLRSDVVLVASCLILCRHSH